MSAVKSKDEVTHETLIATTRVVRQYAGSDVSRAVIEMLDALGASLCEDLVRVTPENLISLQSQLKQTYAIRAVLANDGQGEPRI
jgi:hypothetical protein